MWLRSKGKKYAHVLILTRHIFYFKNSVIVKDIQRSVFLSFYFYICIILWIILNRVVNFLNFRVLKKGKKVISCTVFLVTVWPNAIDWYYFGNHDLFVLFICKIEFQKHKYNSLSRNDKDTCIYFLVLCIKSPWLSQLYFDFVEAPCFVICTWPMDSYNFSLFACIAFTLQ
jgi:hypothetical protein